MELSDQEADMGGRGKGRGRRRVKRQLVDAEDGWTVVTHGLSHLSLAKGERPSKKQEQDRLVGCLPVNAVDGLSLEKMLGDFEKLQERWDDTALACQIKEMVAKRTWDVREAVCIGIGSFSRDWVHRWRSLWQLVLFVAVVERLKEKADEKDGGREEVMSMWAQDPAFTALDTEFLERVGVTVVGSGVEDHIRRTSFVYSPFVDWYLLLPTFLSAASANPTLYIGNDVLDDYAPYAQAGDKQKKLAECNTLGKRFLNGREKMDLREFEAHGSALSGMVAYWTTEEDVGRGKEEERPR